MVAGGWRPPEPAQKCQLDPYGEDTCPGVSPRSVNWQSECLNSPGFSNVK